MSHSEAPRSKKLPHKAQKGLFYAQKSLFLTQGFKIMYIQNIEIIRYEQQKSYFVASYTGFLWRYLVEKKKLTN